MDDQERVPLKDDRGKPPVSLVEPFFIFGMGEVLGDGAKKYGRENWKLGDGDIGFRRRVEDALLRHTLQYIEASKNSDSKHDIDSGHSHLFHIACNAMFLAYYDLRDEVVWSGQDEVIGKEGWDEE